MTRITRLEPSKHIRGRFLVFLEGGEESLLKVTEEEVLRFALHTGKELDDADLPETEICEAFFIINCIYR